MSEATIAAGVQTMLQGMSEFANADVVINDWSILDQANVSAPYVIITTADDFDSRQDVRTPQTRWQIKLTLLENFTDWDTTYNNLQTRRQAIVDKLNTGGDERSAGGLSGVDIQRIYALSPINPWYDPYIPDEQLPEALPSFIEQTIGLDCLEF